MNIDDARIKQMIKSIYDEIEMSDKIYQIEPLILFKYLNIQELIPFEIFVKNALYRIASNDSLKQYIFLKPNIISPNFNIIDEINEHIRRLTNLKNLKKNVQKSKQTMGQDTTKNMKENNQKKLLEKTIGSIDLTKTDKSESNLTGNLKCSFSGLFKLKINEEDILNKELTDYQKNVENKLSNDAKESTEARIKYFDDCNGLIGSSFENSSKKYIFELLNCISMNRDFFFF